LGFVVHAGDGGGGRRLELRDGSLDAIVDVRGIFMATSRDVRRRGRVEIEFVLHPAQALLELDDTLAEGTAYFGKSLAE